MSDLLQIPTTADPFSSFRTVLDGIEYVLTLQYNQRVDAYYLHIDDSAGGRIRSGIKLVTYFPLIRYRPDPRTPPGEFVVLTQGVDDSPPRLGELAPGARCQLCYLPSV